MAQYEKLPEYVAATPQEVAAAHIKLTALKANPAFALMQGARRAAIQAKFHSGMRLNALEYVEFGDIVPPGFSIHANDGLAAQRAEREAREHKARAEFAEMERKRQAMPRPLTQREAQAILGPAAYNEWVSKNQDLIARSVY
jgi:hypothetical protein